MSQFPRLFDPLTLRGVTLRNRTVVCPMGCRSAKEGKPTRGDWEFYRARAMGGAGLVITGGTSVHVTALLKSRTALEPFDPEAIPALRELASAVHSGGAKIIGQINHRGREMLDFDSAKNLDTDFPAWAPSPLPSPNDSLIPHEMTESEIAEIEEAFAVSAKNLVAAGYDGIEIHGAHGYLVAQFLSPQANVRTDRYGGPLENRMRFLLEVLEQVRAVIPEEAPLGVRISADEDLEGGITLDDSKVIAARLRSIGWVDYISVTRGIRNYYIKDMSFPPGVSVGLAHGIRDASGLPIMVAGRITHPTQAEQILADANADLIGMARAWITDPEWANKAQDSRLDEIRPCVGALQDCRTGGGCMHNPSARREATWGPLKPAARAKKVVVVGGGPAGLEAAVVAASRGHDVVLFEREPRLGGQVAIAANGPGRAEIEGVISYRAELLHRLGVRIHLKREATPDDILAEGPDAVVIATGALPREPEEVGWKGNIITAWELLANDSDSRKLAAESREAVVVDDGSGFWETCSAAEYLGTGGSHVTLIAPTRSIGVSIPAESIIPLLVRLRRLGVTLLPMSRVAAVEPGRVCVYDVIRMAATRSLEEVWLPADLVVVNAGKLVNDGLVDRLVGHVAQVHAVGDCVAPRRISHAVLEAHRVARAI